MQESLENICLNFRCRLLDENINLTLEQGETFHMDAFKRMEKSLLPEFKISMEPQRQRI